MSLPRIRSSLVLRTTLLVLGVALGIGLAANEIVGRLARRYEAARTQERIQGLIEVVQPAAAAACFVGDRRLAEETVKGLLNSPSIAAVEIQASEGALAADRHPDRTPAGFEVSRPVLSPFSREQVVGTIRVLPDAGEAARSVARYVWIMRGLALAMAVVLGLALSLTVMRTLVQPIKALSDGLDGLDAAQGTRLEVPPGHDHDEIGRLVRNVNRALDSEAERRRLELQVQQAHAQKLSSLGSLAGGVAHDFNNMLAGIMGYADLLLQEEPSPRRQGHLRAILSAAGRSSALTAKLLAFGRRGKNRAEAVDLAAAVAECLAMLRPSMHPDLQVVPRLEAGLSIDGDPAQIQQVLVNLCINAVEAMPDGGQLTISTRSVGLAEAATALHGVPGGIYAELRVTDTGRGMDAEQVQRIFEPFFTTKTLKGESGTGLGLSTVYGIVETHQGYIEVASAAGVGSTFRVYLPLGKLAPKAPDHERDPGRGEGLVLVVEDEPILQDVARAALEGLGYRVETAGNGRAGVDAFRAHRGRLRAVLLDLKMPVMGGREAFVQMQRLDDSVPVLICTGYGENEEVQDLLSSGAAGLLTKPYRVLELAEAIENVKVKA